MIPKFSLLQSFDIVGYAKYIKTVFFTYTNSAFNFDCQIHYNINLLLTQ